jgi:hypothetical protein
VAAASAAAAVRARKWARVREEAKEKEEGEDTWFPRKPCRKCVARVCVCSSRSAAASVYEALSY